MEQKIKRMVFVLLSMITAWTAYAQATDLVIDNQTPGWLSSKINYGDQLTVKNLKVTGYINQADLDFIGGLTKKNLTGIIDLYESTVVDGYENFSAFFSYVDIVVLQCFKLPQGLKLAENSHLLHPAGTDYMVYTDTLVYNNSFDRFVKFQFLASEWKSVAKNLILGENIDSIPHDAFLLASKLKSVQFLGKIKFVGKNAFSKSGVSKINIKALENIETIQESAFPNVALDTFYCYSDIKQFDINSFAFRENSHVFFDKTVTSFGGTFSNTIQHHYHFKSLTPPGSYNSTAYSKTIVHVPKGTYNAYKEKFPNATIIEDKPVEKVTIAPHELIMNIGETMPLSVSITPTDADDKRITWSSEDEMIVEVDENGLVKAKESGKAKVYAISTENGIKDSCQVIVRKNVKSILFDEPEVILNKIGDNKQLTYTITPEDATDQSVTWKSSNETVCSVSSSGVVLAVAPGTAVITVTTVDGGYTANCVVKVLQHVDALALDKHSLSLKVGEKDKLIATVSPANADDKSLTWVSSDETTASVDDKGNITALKGGDTWIKAVSVDNPEAKDSCKVTVIQPVTGITLSQDSYRLTNIGESFVLEATVLPEDATNKEVKWTTSNDAVCVVSNGKVIATGFGSAVVMAITTDGGFIASCAVLVEKETVSVNGIELSKTDLELIKGQTFQLTATVQPEDATNKNVIWKTSNSQVCDVTQNGLLIATGEGQCIITVVPEVGLGQAQCQVKVKNVEDGIIDLSSDEAESLTPIYNMKGQKVDRVVKGSLYIRNGQKFFAQ